MDPEEQNVRAVHSDWIIALNARDLGRLLTLVTDEVAFLNPGRAPMDREAFARQFEAATRQWVIRCCSDPEIVTVVGDLACVRSSDRVSVADRAGGPEAHLSGHRLTVYRRDAAGRWRIAQDAHTLTPAAP